MAMPSWWAVPHRLHFEPCLCPPPPPQRLPLIPVGPFSSGQRWPVASPPPPKPGLAMWEVSQHSATQKGQGTGQLGSRGRQQEPGLSLVSRVCRCLPPTHPEWLSGPIERFSEGEIRFQEGQRCWGRDPKRSLSHGALQLSSFHLVLGAQLPTPGAPHWGSRSLLVRILGRHPDLPSYRSESSG